MLPPKHATLYVPSHMMTQGYCKFGIGRIPQVLNACIVLTSRPTNTYIHFWHLMFSCPCFKLFNHKTAQIIMSSSSYSWNHDAAQFHPVCFDNQVHISQHPIGNLHPSPEYSPDEKLFAHWSRQVQIWDTHTGHLVSKFPMSEVDRIALSPCLTHSLGKRFIALSLQSEHIICLFDAYTGHLHTQIWMKHMQLWHFYEMEQHWQTIMTMTTTLV